MNPVSLTTRKESRGKCRNCFTWSHVISDLGKSSCMVLLSYALVHTVSHFAVITPLGWNGTRCILWNEMVFKRELKYQRRSDYVFMICTISDSKSVCAFLASDWSDAVALFLWCLLSCFVPGCSVLEWHCIIL